MGVSLLPSVVVGADFIFGLTDWGHWGWSHIGSRVFKGGSYHWRLVGEFVPFMPSCYWFPHVMMIGLLYHCMRQISFPHTQLALNHSLQQRRQRTDIPIQSLCLSMDNLVALVLHVLIVIVTIIVWYRSWRDFIGVYLPNLHNTKIAISYSSVKNTAYDSQILQPRLNVASFSFLLEPLW